MGKYDILYKYIDVFSNDTFGEWFIDKKTDGSAEHPIQMPYVMYSKTVDDFIEDVYLCWEGSGLPMYYHILKEYNIEWNSDSMRSVCVSTLPSEAILALLLGAVRAERFCDGALLGFLKDGSIQKWLLELKRKEETEQ